MSARLIGCWSRWTGSGGRSSIRILLPAVSLRCVLVMLWRGLRRCYGPVSFGGMADGQLWDCSARVDALRVVVQVVPDLDCHVRFELGDTTVSGRPVECGAGWVRVEVWPDWDSSVTLLWDAVLDVEVCGVAA